jgi:hypothetical protein
MDSFFFLTCSRVHGTLGSYGSLRQATKSDLGNTTKYVPRKIHGIGEFEIVIDAPKPY